ncbi:salicylate synthase [Pseudonocardia xinjiangensis]|uniref:salicylate synthase n=1 Tax=Pseudonocardia xinjiangensis TaxID=75289 RepID=UPI0028A615D3|nr:salicylate synthase [Pseudonocardia xinjiangensis]
MPELTPRRTPQYCRTPGPTGVDPLSAALRLARSSRGPYVLYERPDEVSYGAGALVEVLLDRDGIHFRHGPTTTLVPAGDRPLDRVAELLAGTGIEGWRAYGWIAFELSYLLHGLPEAVGAGPLLHLVVPEQEVRLSAGATELRDVRPAGLTELAARLDDARLDDGAGPALPTARATVDDSAGGADYRRAVADAVADIRAERLQKVILSRVVPVAEELDLAATYEAGRRGNTPARSFLLRLGDLCAAGFSPETIVEVAADGTVSTQPLAGTRALSGDAAMDLKLRRELLTDPKEVFEHAVSVQGAHDEIAAMCRPGSVHVDGFMQVSERGSVQHLASRVTGRLREGRTCWDAFAGLFPAVTASGLPKPAACAAIRDHETEQRGLYSGAVVVADADGSLDAALVLRTVFQQGGRTWLRAGAGVVGQSTPEREFEETREKLRSVSRYLVPAARTVRAGADPAPAVAS